MKLVFDYDDLKTDLGSVAHPYAGFNFGGPQDWQQFYSHHVYERSRFMIIVGRDGTLAIEPKGSANEINFNDERTLAIFEVLHRYIFEGGNPDAKEHPLHPKHDQLTSGQEETP